EKKKKEGVDDGFGSKAEGRDGLAREAPVIAYTEKIIEEEQLQLKNILLTVSFLALEHLRKKIELSTERIHAAKLREDEARKVQESSNTQYARLEELKRRLETVAHQQQPMLIRLTRKKTEGKEEGGKEHGQRPATAEGESKSRKKPQIQGRGRGIGIMNNKGRGGWTGAGFDVDVRT
ncbi:hypothetical protein F2Q68_00021334, partial [Brassica cretica]